MPSGRRLRDVNEIYIFHMHIGKLAGASGVEDNRPGCASTAG
jgi:hypothetical protein